MNNGIGLLQRAVSYTLGAVDTVTADLFSRPTPCSQWDLHMLLEHASESAAAFHEGLEGGRVGLFSTIGYDIAADPVSVFRARLIKLADDWMTDHAARSVAIADRLIPLSVASGAAAVEIAVHGWDIAQASGDRRPIPPDLAAGLRAISALLLSDGNRHPLFAPPVRPPTAAGPSDELLAFLGRPAGVTCGRQPTRTDTT